MKAQYPYNFIIKVFGSTENIDINTFDETIHQVFNDVSFPKRYVEFFDLKYKDNLTLDEISQKYNCTKQNVSKALSNIIVRINNPETKALFCGRKAQLGSEPILENTEIVKPVYKIDYNTNIVDLDFSEPVRKSLLDNNIRTLGELIIEAKKGFSNIAWFGLARKNEICDKLAKFGIYCTKQDLKIESKLRKIMSSCKCDANTLIDILRGMSL